MTTIAYDALNREQTKVFANGMIATHVYDPAGRQTALNYLVSNGAPVAAYTATYDNVGNRLTVAAAGLNQAGGAISQAATYVYDPTNQLIAYNQSGANPSQETYTYDPVGNRLLSLSAAGPTTYTYNAANERISFGTPTLSWSSSYDANGNLIVDTDPSTLAVANYIWDPSNRLTAVQYPSGGGAPFTNTYDANGLRQSNKLGTTLTEFVWDNQNLLAQQTKAGLSVTGWQYTELPGVWGGLVSQREVNVDTSSFFTFDPSGNCRLLMQSGGTAASSSQDFTPFGVSLASAGGAPPFQFGGQWGYFNNSFLGATVALVNIGGRWYIVNHGDWISRDPLPVDLGGSLNPYEFVGNNPVTWIDPSGLQTLAPPAPPPVIIPPPPAPPPVIPQPPAPPPVIRWPPGMQRSLLFCAEDVAATCSFIVKAGAVVGLFVCSEKPAGGPGDTPNPNPPSRQECKYDCADESQYHRGALGKAYARMPAKCRKLLAPGTFEKIMQDCVAICVNDCVGGNGVNWPYGDPRCNPKTIKKVMCEQSFNPRDPYPSS